MRDILSARQAARVIGCNAAKVQERLLRGEWTFGTAIKSPSKCYISYEINKRDLADFLRISVEELEGRLNDAG